MCPKKSTDELESLKKELEQKRLELDLLNKISRTFWTALDLHMMSQHVFKLIRQRIDINTYTLFLTHDADPHLLVASHMTVPPYVVEDLRKHVLEHYHKHVGEVIDPKQMVVTHAEDDQKKEWNQQAVKGFHSKPLSVLDRTFGLVGLSTPDERPLSPEDEIFFNIVVNEVALFAENDRIRRDLEKERNLLASILHSMTSAIVVVDHHQHILLSNPVADAFLGIKSDQVIGKSVQQAVSNADLCALFDVLTAQPSEFLSREVTITNADGNAMMVKANLAKVKSRSGQQTGVVMVLNDITREKDLDKVRADFISITSHELRTPLAAIKEAVALILDGVTGSINDRQHQFLDMASRNIDRLAAIINDLLDLSKIESGKMQLVHSLYNLNKIAEEVANTFDAVAKENGIHIELALAKDLPDAQLDRTRVTQLLNNLVSNAIKFTPKGGKITIGSRKETPKFVEMSVHDTGIGISQKDMGRLFRRFQQLDSGLTKSAGGTGLGLAISKEIAEIHGGRIWVESQPGKGSTFYFTIPIQSTSAAKGQKTILIIDDDDEVSEVLKTRLEKGEYRVILAKTGEEGVTLVKEMRPDLVILDILLPDIDGFEVCKRLKGEPQTALIPIMMLTAVGQENATWRALSLGVEAYMVKPLELKALLKAVQEFLK